MEPADESSEEPADIEDETAAPEPAREDSAEPDSPEDGAEEAESQASAEPPPSRGETGASGPRRESRFERRPRKEKPKEQTFDVSKSLDAPRRKHGTRVVFTFTCAGCGSDASLDYKPKGLSPDELLCEECMADQENAGRWKLIRAKKAQEERNKTFELVCTICGHIEYSRRPPRRGRDHKCQRCWMEQAQPDKSRLEGAKKVEGGVMVRRNTSKDED